eukprot:NODE_479_length_6970_cov_0.750982.p4 type:complete len:201 gc:universal NODE_479_length_6970_cov_0.750982:712-110(-)
MLIVTLYALDQTTQQTMLNMINQLRQQSNIAPLVISNSLNDIAQHYSEKQAQYGMGHSVDGTTFTSRIRRYYTGRPVSENIGMGYSSITDVVNGWMNDPPHLRNMMDPNANEIGIGMAYGNGKAYWTQDFGYLNTGHSESHYKEKNESHEHHESQESHKTYHKSQKSDYPTAPTVKDDSFEYSSANTLRMSLFMIYMVLI